MPAGLYFDREGCRTGIPPIDEYRKSGGLCRPVESARLLDLEHPRRHIDSYWVTVTVRIDQPAASGIERVGVAGLFDPLVGHYSQLAEFEWLMRRRSAYRAGPLAV